MNEVLRAIETRRSCRRFKPAPVKEEELDLILAAGLRAPSGGNAQSCHLTVLCDRELLGRINGEMLRTFASSGDPFLISVAKREDKDLFYGAPTAVVVSGNRDAITPQDDMAVASQNMMLAAESIGVASCWIGFGGAISAPENIDTFSRLLALPPRHIPHHAVVFGYRDGEARGPVKIKDGRVNQVP